MDSLNFGVLSSRTDIELTENLIEKYFKVYDMLIDEVKSALPDIKIMIMEPFVLKACATEEKWDCLIRYWI